MLFNLQNSQKFKDEVDSWYHEGIITPQQHQQLYNRYQLHQTSQGFRISYILSGLAILLITLGLFLLLSENWDKIPTLGKSLITFSPLLGSLLAGIYLQQRTRTEPAELAFLIASMFLGLNIFLQAQIFHISSYYPNGILAWLVGMSPFVYYYRSQLFIASAQILYIMWVGTEMQYNQMSYLSPIILLALLWLSYKSPSILQILLSSVSGLVLSMQLIYRIYGTFSDLEVLFWPATYALVWYGILQHIIYRRPTENYENLVHIPSIAILAIIYLISFEDIAKPLSQSGLSLISPLYLMFGTAAILTLRPLKTENIWPIILVSFILISKTIPHQISINHSTLIAVAANILLLANALWRLQRGYTERDKPIFMSGVFIIVILALTRYFNLITDAYYLSALIFIGTGLLLWGINAYWNKALRNTSAN
ncbi:MAG: hypothetical protein RIS47_300 [Bacteroidota bacterium]|jgi:uncharacterized membrane protein